MHLVEGGRVKREERAMNSPNSPNARKALRDYREQPSSSSCCLSASPRPRDLSILVEHQQQHKHLVHVFTQHPALPVLIAQYVHQRRLDVARDHSATAASTPYAPTTSKGLL